MSRTAGNGSAGRVLVVEDDEGIREMLKYNLASAGFSVQEARDGAAGLRTARTARPDLILLDLMLPTRSCAAQHLTPTSPSRSLSATPSASSASTAPRDAWSSTGETSS